MKRLTHNALVYYQFDALQDAALRHGVFTRLGGVSQGMYSSLNLSRSTGDTLEPVLENRRRMFEALSLRVERSLTSWLVHGNTVRVVTHADIGQNDVHADAMITNTPGLALTLRFADCVPVLFHDPTRQAIGIAHAGWPGIVAQVLPATVEAMRRAYSSQPGDIRACIGPSIGPDKFEVGEDVAAKIQASVSENIVIAPPANGHSNDEPVLKPHVDLWRSARSQLYDAGVRHIETARICTASNTSEWFSHRAEKGKTGRFGAVIELRS
jgi:YfiH family protein